LKVLQFLKFFGLSLFIPNKELRQAELLKLYDFICSCPACLNNYPPEAVNPPIKHYLKPLSQSKRFWKSEINKLSDVIKKNVKPCPSKKIQTCEYQMVKIIQNACQLHDWPHPQNC
jgi:hypothetical protein